jgi:hypothetical protein
MWNTKKIHYASALLVSMFACITEVLLSPLPMVPQKALAQWRSACNDLTPGWWWASADIPRGCLSVFNQGVF